MKKTKKKNKSPATKKAAAEEPKAMMNKSPGAKKSATEESKAKHKKEKA